MTNTQHNTFPSGAFRLCLIAFIMVATVPWSMAQTGVMDSLQTLYDNAIDDSTRLARLNNLSFHALRGDIDQAERLSSFMLSYGDSVGIHEQDAAALDYLGIAAFLHGDYEGAMNYYKEALEKAHELKDSVIIAGAINNMGLVYLRLGSYEKAFEYIQEASGIVHAIGFERDYTTSLCNLGTILQEMEDYDLARQYFERCVASGQQVGLSTLYALAYSKLGQVAEKQNEDSLALSFFTIALDSYDEDDRYGRSTTLIHLGSLYTKTGAVKKAEEALDSAYRMSVRYQHEEGQKFALKAIGDLIRYQGKYDNAILHYQESLRLDAQNTKNDHLKKETLKAIADSYATKGDFEKAYQYHIAYKAENDSLLTKDKVAIVTALQIEHGVQQKEAENALLKKQQEAQEAQLELQQWILAFAVLLLVLLAAIAAVAYHNFKRKKEYSKILEEEVDERTAELSAFNKQLERFAHTASHDLRQPLRNITGFVQLMQRRIRKQYGTDKDLQEYMDYICRGTRKLNGLINDMLTFTTIKNKAITYEQVDPSQLIEQELSALYKQQPNRTVELKYGDLLPVHTNRSMLQSVLSNLISNAVKYNESKNVVVTISTFQENGSICFCVKDNGIGISLEYHEKIFGLFNRLNNKDYEGSGLGLSICKRIVEQLGGQIWVESNPEEGQQGSTFYFTLPQRVTLPKQQTSSTHEKS